MKKMIGTLIVISFCGSLGFGATQKEKESVAVVSAKAWLKIVDNAKYAKSWQEAASFFKAQVSGKQWEKAVTAARTPFGKMISRKLKSKTYKTQLPGAPDGEYVVIQFTTKFQNKKNAIETITPMLDKDKKWRVSGYFIR